MKNEEIRKNLKCVRALDGILLGIILVIPIITFQNILLTIPSTLIKYIIIVPAFIIFRSSFRIPNGLYTVKAWRNHLRRMRFFITGSLALSPFWSWWNQALENSYLILNIGFLLLFSMLYIYNLVSLSSVSATEKGNRKFANFAKLTRLWVIYIMIAPFLAFLLTTWFTDKTCWEIVIFQIQNQKLILPFFLIPLFMTIFVILQWRRKLVDF